MKNKTRNKLGFTLLELLVVVVVIGILAGIALPQYRFAVLKSKYSTLKSMTDAIHQAEQRYYLVYNEFTNDFQNLDIDKDTNSICTINTSNKYLSCTLRENNKNLFTYEISFEGRKRRCTAQSTDKTDILNRVCKMETKEQEPYCRDQDDVHYCAYMY